MTGEHTVLPATITISQQGEITLMSPRRLDTARERIDAVCTEYNHFSPSCVVAELKPSTISSNGAESERCFRSPDRDQLRTDLQVLLERFLALDSDEADNAYRRISLRAWEAANDEYGAFDWERFKDIIRDEVEELKERDCYVDFSDLVTLRTMTACL